LILEQIDLHADTALEVAGVQHAHTADGEVHAATLLALAFPWPKLHAAWFHLKFSSRNGHELVATDSTLLVAGKKKQKTIVQLILGVDNLRCTRACAGCLISDYVITPYSMPLATDVDSDWPFILHIICKVRRIAGAWNVPALTTSGARSPQYTNARARERARDSVNWFRCEWRSLPRCNNFH
jgi:hypothetical protein